MIALANRKAVEIGHCVKIGAVRCLLGLQSNAGRVGDPVDRIEEADDTSRIDQCRRTQRC